MAINCKLRSTEFYIVYYNFGKRWFLWSNYFSIPNLEDNKGDDKVFMNIMIFFVYE